MKKNIWAILGLIVSVGVLCAPGGAQKAMAGVSVGVNIGLPPFVFSAPPPVVVIPGTYVYVIPDVDVAILFYHGYWYRPYQGHWYRASSYNGPWVYLELSRVPRALVELPPSYYAVAPQYHHIPYAELRANWGRWERERHWDRDREWRAGWQGRAEGRGREEWGRGPERHEGHEGRRGELY
jgi:hypothetical protein